MSDSAVAAEDAASKDVSAVETSSKGCSQRD